MLLSELLMMHLFHQDNFRRLKIGNKDQSAINGETG